MQSVFTQISVKGEVVYETQGELHTALHSLVSSKFPEPCLIEIYGELGGATLTYGRKTKKAQLYSDNILKYLNKYFKGANDVCVGYEQYQYLYVEKFTLDERNLLLMHCDSGCKVFYVNDYDFRDGERDYQLKRLQEVLSSTRAEVLK